MRAECGSAELFVGIFVHAQGVLVLPPELAVRLGELGLAPSLDIYP